MNSIPIEFSNTIYVSNAGLTLLWPYLGTLFERCGLTDQNSFVDEQSKHKAVKLLAYATTGNPDNEEVSINKLLCGMPISDTIEGNILLNDENKEIVDSLLRAVIQNWSVLGETSIDELRHSFLQRVGKLVEEEEQYFLKIEQKPFDMLLDQIPWSINSIRLGWIKKDIVVEWR